MIRSLLIALFCATLAACNSSGDNPSADTGAPSSGSSTDVDFNPATMAVEAPPTDGKLPADLLPPA